MTFAADSLADGQLPTVQGDIYTSPANTVTYLKNLALFNENAATQTIALYLKRNGGSARWWKRFVLQQYQSADAIDKELILGIGDSIEAVTTTASAVNYYIAGVVESVPT